MTREQEIQAARQAAEDLITEDAALGASAGPWTAHDDDGTGTLPCVLSDKVTPYGNFYVAQCNRFEDAKLCAAAPDLADALEALRFAARARENTMGDACRLLECKANLESAVKVAEEALRKAGRIS